MAIGVPSEGEVFEEITGHTGALPAGLPCSERTAAPKTIWVGNDVSGGRADGGRISPVLAAPLEECGAGCVGAGAWEAFQDVVEEKIAGEFAGSQHVIEVCAGAEGPKMVQAFGVGETGGDGVDQTLRT